MDLDKLRARLDRLIGSLQEEDQRSLEVRLRALISAFPFNEYEYVITFLADRRILSFSEYEKLRQDYVSGNRYLDLYGLAPRIFGQVWGEKHLRDLDGRFRKPDRSIDPNYDGQYDLWLEGVRIEVKAARGINTRQRGSLVAKALPCDSEEPFWMNFQQLKLDVCEVFVFIGVWVDRIVYWVMSNQEVKDCRFLSHQHRGGIEYQIGITDRNRTEFNAYLTEPGAVAETVISKGRRA
jgi:hypothetical protein